VRLGLGCLAEKWREPEGGMFSWWQGFVVRVAHVALTTALMKTLTSIVYELIYGKPPLPHHITRKGADH
jgi:hypothetical protein